MGLTKTPFSNGHKKNHGHLSNRKRREETMLIQKHGEADILHKALSAIFQCPINRQTKSQEELIDRSAYSITAFRLNHSSHDRGWDPHL